MTTGARGAGRGWNGIKPIGEWGVCGLHCVGAAVNVVPILATCLGGLFRFYSISAAIDFVVALAVGVGTFLVDARRA